MKDRLKEYIDQNADAFNSFDAPAGAWDKIEHQLHGKRQKRFSLMKYGSIASAAALVGFILYAVTFNQPVNNEVIAENQELTETELYYASQVNQKRAMIYQMSAKYPELKMEMDNDLAELDTILVELKNDLKDNVDNAEVVDAMIQNYRMKLMILEDIMLFLEDQEPENNEPKHTAYEL